MHTTAQGKPTDAPVHAQPDEEQHLLRMSAAEAAEACGINRSTIIRRIKKGHFPGAIQASNGAWSIPVPDLLAAGLNPGKPAPAPNAQAQEQDAQGSAQAQEQVITIPFSEYVDLRARADRYEAIADERGRALEDLRRMTMAIEPVESSEARKKRRWWHKG